MKKLLLFILGLATNLVGAQILFDGNSYALFSTGRSGIHKIDGQTLIDRGVLSEGDPLNELVVLYRPQGELSHTNGVSNQALAPSYIKVIDSDGKLDAQSMVLFYVSAPYTTLLSDSLYDYAEHAYSEREYVLVGRKSGAELGMKITDQNGTSPSRTIGQFRQFHIVDTAQTNLMATGRRWFGDLFDFTTERSYPLPLSVVTGTPIEVSINAVARANSSNTTLEVIGGGTVAFPAVGTNSVSNYVTERDLQTQIVAASTSEEIGIRYNKSGNSGAAMWLDKLVVNYWSNNNYENSGSYQKRFQNFPRSASHSSQIEIEASNVADPYVFEITNPAFVREIAADRQGGMLTWVSKEDTLREYVVVASSDAFGLRFEGTGTLLDPSSLLTAQNLIIAPDSLMLQAERLATLHEAHGLPSKAIALEAVYAFQNAGTPDIAAIREFLYELYNTSGSSLEYLTLFGDASYDYKGKLASWSNLVPTFESYQSFSLYSSYITDDYFGYLDDGEGLNWFVSDLDIGIGRMPVTDNKSARAAVDKVERYLESMDRFGSWRSNAVLVADDADEAWEKEFAIVQDQLARYLDTARPELELIKIYSDAFTQESKPGSQRYPTAREKLYREVEEGALLVSFVGHGGEVGWTTERILQLEDITNWSNGTALPVFTTITCEFTRFDDANRVSAGEQLYLNPNGGAIALFSTTRSVFATNSTYDLNRLLNRNMMTLEQPRLGDVLRVTKNNNISGDKIKFSLIGDPALPLARPKHSVVFDSINGISWQSFTDTLKALSWVQFSGAVTDQNGTQLQDFNGEVSVRVFDKAQPQRTKVNDGAGGVFNFSAQNNAIFKGKASVRQGRFTVEFRVPLDINLAVGNAKVLAYATNNQEDAWGGNNGLLIGDVFDGVITDTEGPKVRLFVNDTNFISGGITNANPLGLGLLTDESGINAVGLGIGHNITMTLDGEQINVNDFYESNLNEFGSGTVRYPFYDLEIGEHSLELLAWDVLNQWGRDSISFVVVDAQEPILEQLLVYPNPFTEEVHFALSHNQQDEKGTLRLDLLNNQGQTAYTWEQELELGYDDVVIPSFKVSSVPAGKLTSGFYYARVQWVSESNRKSALIQEKLIFIR